MEFGICTSVKNSDAVKRAGWDFVEENVQSLLKGQTPDSEWTGDAEAAASVLPVLAANSLVPGSLKITGPTADRAALDHYLATVIRRAKGIGIKTIVFGSGDARKVPEGFDRDTAKGQIIDFATTAAGLAANAGIMVVIEPLNRGETNIVNTVAEGMQIVREINHPNFQCLVDTYHMWLEDEPLEHIADAIGSLRHVHVADKEGRVAPGLSGKSDYHPIFKILRQGNYSGRISFEGKVMADFDSTAPRVLAHLRQQWESCLS